MPLIVGAVAVVAILAVFFGMRFISGPPEFEGPKTEKVIPGYIFSKMKPADQQKLKDEGYRVTDGPSAPAPGAPTSRP